MAARMVRFDDDDDVAPLLRSRFFWYQEDDARRTGQLHGHFHIWLEATEKSAVQAWRTNTLPPEVEAAALRLAVARAMEEPLPAATQALCNAGVRLDRAMTAIVRQLKAWGCGLHYNVFSTSGLDDLRQFADKALQAQPERLDELGLLWQEALRAASALTQEENVYFGLHS